MAVFAAHGAWVTVHSEQPPLVAILVVLGVAGLLVAVWPRPLRALPTGAGEIVATAAAVRLMTLDGGLSGWFLFWPLVLLFWFSVVRYSEHLTWCVILAGAGYLVAVAVAFPLDTGETVRLLQVVGAALLGWTAYLQIKGREKKVRHLENFLADVLDSSPIALAVVEPRSGAISYANRTASEWVERPLTGSTLAEAEANLAAVGIKTGAANLAAFLTSAADGTTPAAEVFDFMMPSGAKRLLRLVASPHANRQGGTASVVLWAEDVTSQIQLGEERRRFLEAAGHHLRTPLTPIVGWAQMLADGTLDPEDCNEAIREILEGARSLERLFERMLSVTRLPYNPGLSDIEVGELLDRHLRPLDRDLYAEITIDGDRDIPVRCHPDAIAGSLYELFDNSRRFGEKPYTLTWAPTETMVEMKASDAGPGPVLPAGRTQNLLPWSPLSPSDEMPKEMGNRLGLAHAITLASLGGSRLDFIRMPDRWHFALRLPERSPTRDLVGTT